MTAFSRTQLVSHGNDIAGTFAKRPTEADNGSRYFADDVQRGFTYDSRRKLWWPDDGLYFYDATENYLVDHFGGDTLNTAYSVNKGGAGSDANFTISAGAGGIITCTTGTSDNNTVAITGAATIFKPSDGLIRFGTRLKVDDITEIAIYAGLTDVIATTLEMPFELATATYTSTASDACGLLFDTDATTDTIRLVGVAADTDATHVDSSTAYVNDTYIDLLFELTAAGVLTGYLDETAISTTVASAATLATNLVPIIVAENRADSNSHTITVDYWFCHQDG